MTSRPSTSEELRVELEARRRAYDEDQARRAALAVVPEPADDLDDNVEAEPLANDQPGVVVEPGPDDDGGLVVPDVADLDVMTAALEFAKAGWYVGPCRGKHPGSVLGKGWPHLTSRDPRTIIDWYAGMPEGLGVFGHCGRSGVVGIDIDVDTEDSRHVREVLDAAGAPYFTTRRSDGGIRRTYLVRVTSPVSNKSPWEGIDVRGNNGVVILPPSPHPEPDGLYRWQRMGPVPMCPAELMEQLTPAGSAEATTTDAEVARFLAGVAVVAPRPDGRAEAMLKRYRREAAARSRHQALVSVAPWFMRALMAGVAGREDVETLVSAHLALLADASHRNGARAGGDEVKGVLAWALAQAEASPDLPQSNDDYVAALEAANPPAARLEPPGSPDGQAGAEDGPGHAGEAGGSDPAAHLETLDWHEVFAGEVQPEPWLAWPLVSRGRLVALFSAPKVGKSLLGLEMAAALATGRPFMGQTTTQSDVLYVDLENTVQGDVRPRLEAMGYGPGDLDRLHYLSFPNLAALDSPRGGEQLLAAARRWGADVVVVDTVSRVVQGEENDNDTWLRFYRDTGVALKREGVACLRLDHTGKDVDRGPRGGSAKSGDVDVEWRMTKHGGEVFRITLHSERFPVGVDAVEFRREASPLRSIYQGPAASPNRELNDAERVTYDAIRSSPGTTVAGLQKVTSKSKATVQRHTRSLMRDGYVRSEPAPGRVQGAQVWYVVEGADRP
jgi:hypothetical protein